MKKKVNSLSCNVYTSHGEILKDFFFFFKYVTISTIVYFHIFMKFEHFKGLTLNLEVPQ